MPPGCLAVETPKAMSRLSSTAPRACRSSHRRDSRRATWDEIHGHPPAGASGAVNHVGRYRRRAWRISDDSTVAGKMGYASMPSLDGAKPGAADLGAWNFGINSSGKNKEAAYLFTAWALSQGTQKLIGEGGGLPSLTSTFQDPALVAKFPYWTQAMTSLEELRTRPRIPEAPAITDALALALSQVLSGGQNAKAGLDGAQQQVQTIMNGHLPVTDEPGDNGSGRTVDLAYPHRAWRSIRHPGRRDGSLNTDNPAPPAQGCRCLHRWLLAPSVLVLGAVVLFPLIYSVNLSLRHYNPMLPDATGGWAGLSNYARLLHDSQFHHALLVTMIFVVVAVGLETVLGTLLGIFLNRMVSARRVVTSVLLLPMIATPLVVGLVFSFGLNPDFGYITWFLQTIGLSSADSLLAKPATALTVLILVDVWEWVPFVALMALAGLRALPTSPIEAARLDGCSTVQIHTRIILPMLRPVPRVAILFRATEAVREFDKVYILTGGGPGSSTTVNDLFQYRISFTNFDLSYGAALGLVTFAAMLIVTALTFRTITRSAVSS